MNDLDFGAGKEKEYLRTVQWLYIKFSRLNIKTNISHMRLLYLRKIQEHKQKLNLC